MTSTLFSIQAPFPRKPAAVIPRGGKDGQEPAKPVPRHVPPSVTDITDLISLSPAQGQAPQPPSSPQPLPLEVNSMVTMQTQSLRPFHATLGELARSPSPSTGAPPSHPLSIISSSPPSASLSITPIDFSSLAGSPMASYTPPIRTGNPQPCQLAFYQAQIVQQSAYSSGVPEGAEVGLLAISPSPIRPYPYYFQATCEGTRSRSNSMG